MPDSINDALNDASFAAPSGHESIAHVNGIDLCYQTFGDATRPALLLIMGLGTQMLGWDEGFCKALADRGYFVIRFDNRDIGKSTWLDHESAPGMMALITKSRLGMKLKVPYTLKDMAADTVGLLDVLGIARAHVVGASMGGMIGQEIAIHHPERMLTFTSIMSSTGNPKLPGPKREALALMMAAPATDEASFLAAYAAMWKVLRAGRFPEDEARDAERGRAVWARGYHPAGSARQFAAIFASGNRTKALKNVKVPTLVVHGRADPLVPFEAGVATAEAIPNAKLHAIETMGHALPRSMWGELIEVIARHAQPH